MRNWLNDRSIQPYIRLLLRILLTGFAILIIIHVTPTVLSFLLPFILAFAVASAFNPLICFLQKKWSAPRGISSVFMVVVTVLFVASILGGFIYALAQEIIILAQDIDGVLEYFSDSIETLSIQLHWMLQFLPADTEEILTGIMDGFMAWAQAQGAAFADTVIVRTVNATTQIGTGVITLVIFIMASYFMMADYPRLSEKLRNLLIASRVYDSYNTFKNAVFSALGKFLRAQLLLAFIVFILSLIGLLIIGQNFAVLIAFILAILDFLPLVGTAAVLIPWGIINIVTGYVPRGIYLIAMNLTIFILRRIIEPKVVSSQTGLTPLVTLVSFYFGLRLGGLIGLILGPIVAMIIISVYKAGLFNGWIKDINDVIALLKGQEP